MPGSKWRSVLLAMIGLSLPAPGFANPFRFVAYGDTGYYLPRDIPRVRMLVAAINREQPVFAIHVGDMKGVTPCTNEDYLQRRSLLQLHGHPVVMTPGDNDWADCGDEAAGSFDPLERLAAVRRMFHSEGVTLGQGALALTRQSAVIPENARWTTEGVVFATVHAIGPHNGLIVDERRAGEAIQRSNAGRAWIEEAFRIARDSRAPAIVIATQANAWAPNTMANAFDWLTDTIRRESSTYSGQVLVVHGDSHRLLIDTPYRSVDAARGTSALHNVTRLMVPGSPDHRAVTIDVNPSRAGVFSFSVAMDPSEVAGAAE